MNHPDLHLIFQPKNNFFFHVAVMSTRFRCTRKKCFWRLLKSVVWRCSESPKRVKLSFKFPKKTLLWNFSYLFINKLKIFLPIDRPSRFHTRKFSLYQVATDSLKKIYHPRLQWKPRRWIGEKISTQVFPRIFKIIINLINPPEDLLIPRWLYFKSLNYVCRV